MSSFSGFSNKGVTSLTSQITSKVDSSEISFRLSRLGISSELLAPSYLANTTKEKTMLLYVQNFSRQFSYLYQDRKIPFLAAENEIGLQKVVCTTLRPTAMKYDELSTWNGCAELVADYLILEPLENPTVVPNRLLSPGTVLKRRRGNCFEYSTVLCSLLLGMGYDAYVVNGYATEDVCTVCTEREDCPIVTEEEEAAVTVEEVTVNKYTMMGVKPECKSKFAEKLEKRRIAVEKRVQEEERLRQIANQEIALQPPHDPLYGQRVHSWILVKSGKREIGLDFFIEPTLGWQIPLNTTKYLGIESIWNNENYWVNMQHCKEGVKDMFYELTDVGMWECFLPYVQVTLPTPSESIYDMEDAPIPFSQEKIDMPTPWPTAIPITARDIQIRFPFSKKTEFFKYKKVEKFNVSEMKDGLVSRICHYRTWDRKDLQLVEENFRMRADQLYYKRFDHISNCVTEYYKPGQHNALREHTYKSNDSTPQADRLLTFYQEKRADGLASREVKQEELIDHYEGRMDFLTYRHTCFGVRIKKFGPVATTQKTILKINEKYDRNVDKEANDDISEVIYDIGNYKIKVIYHRQDDKIASSWREFSKPNENDHREYQKDFTLDSMKEFQADPNAKSLSRLDAFMILYDLTQNEARTLNRIRDDEAELQALLLDRAHEEVSCNLNISPYNIVRRDEIRKARLEKLQEKMEDSQTLEKEQDFLKPYLIQLDSASSQLSIRQAQQVVEACLHDYKMQLIEQFNIMKSHHETETQKLKQLQEYFHENTGNMTSKEQIAHRKKCDEISFKLKVLETRLMQHKETAAQKYLVLEKKVKSDQRFVHLTS